MDGREDSEDSRSSGDRETGRPAAVETEELDMHLGDISDASERVTNEVAQYLIPITGIDPHQVSDTRLLLCVCTALEVYFDRQIQLCK